ncbi:MAG: efflux RND transporter permease subunit, partial [Clostridiales bacterium]|jgi:HAE1 family hydrophobic/amphiphilic exporter-1|nr:efflux RND transporter permease subunit [Clostridiales bacterium]
MEFMPQTDEGIIMISVSMPRGTILEETEAKTKQIQNLLVAEFSEIDLDYVAAGTFGGFSGGGSDTGDIIFLLKNKNDRDRSANDIAAAMETVVKTVPGCEVSVSAMSMSMGGGAAGGGTIALNIYGDDLATLQETAKDIEKIVAGIPGTREVSTSLEDAAPRATVRVNREKAAAFGISPASVSSIVSTAVSGSVASTYRVNGQELDIRVRQNKDNFDYITDIQNILIPTPTGANVPLYEIAEILTEDIPASISKENQEIYVSVSTMLAGDNVKTNEVVDAITAAMNNYPMADGYHWAFTGSQENMAETFASLGLALIMAILIVYMIMAAEFESLLYPLIVMFSIPVAMTGGLFGLFISGLSLNVTALLGLIMLAGVVVNNAIVLIDYTNLLIKERGMTMMDALMTAGPIRLRPILMTTLTTVLGLIPMLTSQADGAELMRSLAGVVIFGLSLSTLITLLFIPTVYVALTNMRNKLAGFINKIKAKRLGQYTTPAKDEK